MKRISFLVLLILVPFFTKAQDNKNFDFSAVCSTGQTLYYHIVKDKKILNQYYVQNAGNVVEVTYPYSSEFWDGGYRGYTEPANNVVIPSQVTYKGVSYKVVAIGSCAFRDCKGLKSVVIPNTVNIICSSAFRDCMSLESITLPNSLKEIGSFSIEKCSALKSLNIPNTVRKLGDYAFIRAGLTSIVFPNSWAKIPKYVCEECLKLQTVTLPTNLKEIPKNAFSYCPELTTVAIPNTVTKIDDWAFNDCYSLQVEVPNTVAEVVGNAFGNCLNVIYHGNLKGAPWGAKCLNGYVEGEYVYKDKTKNTLVACSVKEEKRRQEAARAEQERQKLAEIRRAQREAEKRAEKEKLSSLNVNNIMKEVESIEKKDEDRLRIEYRVRFKDYRWSEIYYNKHDGKWEVYEFGLFYDYYAPEPNSKEAAILLLYQKTH